MKFVYLIVLLIISSNAISQDYYPDRLYLKIKDDLSSRIDGKVDSIMSSVLKERAVVSFKKAFVSKELNSIYEIQFKDSTNLEVLISEIEKLSFVQYVEKIPIYKLFYTPNDPSYSSQWNLSKILADQAWGIHQGGSQVKIAITDIAFLLNHQDLVNQWYINPGETPGNGVDDDGNGYIDDWRGWDAADNDNDPSVPSGMTATVWSHGNHVAGISAAETNNSTGIAAIGFNCKLIPVKNGASSSGALIGAMRSVDYAISAGADVINMSWGGGAPSTTNQIVFNLAYSKGILCVAAAGNSSTSSPMYPAAYNHVISVAATDNSDILASFSNYGSSIDVCAPGVNILSAYQNSTASYNTMSGTSMASPLVAGLCALMKSYNPMPIDSIEACLKRTCDNINSVNPTRIGNIGAGRVNALQALQCMTKKPVSKLSAKQSIQCLNQNVQFNALSFGAPTLSYSWSFPGGSPTTSTLKNPVVTYSSNGWKSATLITCNSQGCDTITNSNIIFIDTPKAKLKTDTIKLVGQVGVAHLTINFTGNPPYSIGISNGTISTNYINLRQNPSFIQVPINKDTTNFTLTSYSDSSCVGLYSGNTIVYRRTPKYDTTICITLKTSDAGAEDFIFNYGSSSSAVNSSLNEVEFTSERWTSSGSPFNIDAVAKFNLNSIPANAIINSALLNLYTNTSIANWANQPTAGTNNAATIKRVLSAWTSSSLPSTYPSLSSSNSVALAQSSSTNQNYLNIDIKGIINDIRSSGVNYGMLLAINTTSYYNSLQFHSKSSVDTSKHPTLFVCFTVPGIDSSPPPGSQVCESSFKFSTTNSNQFVRIQTPNPGLLYDSTVGFTWECWFNLGNRNSSQVTSYEYLITAIDGVGYNDINLGFNWPNSGFNFIVSSNGTGGWPPTKTITYNPSFSANTWYHVAAVCDYINDSISLYINGNLINKVYNHYNSADRMGNPAIPVNIGNMDSTAFAGFGSSQFRGLIDEVRIWKGARTQTQIQNNMKVCLPANTTNLVAYYKADEGSGSMASNMVNSSFSGRLSSGVSWGPQVDSMGNCTYCSSSLCLDSIEINSRQSGWQALQTNGSWGSLSSCNYVTSIFTANAASFPGMSSGDCLWGPIVSSGNRTAYNSSSGTTTSVYSGSFCKTRKQFTLPSGAYIDSIRLWALSDDMIDTVWINSKPVYSATNPVHYGQILITGSDINVGNSLATNEVIVKSGDFGGSYGTYLRMMVYYTLPCSSDCDTTKLNQGLVLNLPFNGNTNDISGKNNHATNYGASLTAGKGGVANTAYYFNGSSYMNVTHNSNLNVRTFSITAIVKPIKFNSTTCPANQILGKGYGTSTSNNGYSMNYYPTNPGSSCTSFDTNYNNFTLTGSSGCNVSNVNNAPYVKSGTWYCVVATYDSATQELKTYVDGILRHQCTISLGLLSNSNTQSLLIGKHGDPTWAYWMNGVIDDIRIYSRVLTPAEVKGYCGTCQVQPPPIDCDTTNLNTGLVLNLPFNGNTNDISGNNNHATNYGASLTAGKSGVSNTAYRFDNTNYMSIAHSSSLNLRNLSITAILKPLRFNTDVCYGNSVLSKGANGAPGQWSLVYSPADNGSTCYGRDTNLNNVLLCGNSCSASWYIPDTPYMKHNQWNCVVATYDSLSKVAKMYVDGKLRHQWTTTWDLLSNSNTMNMLIGKFAGTGYPFWINAVIDDIRVYNRVLAPAEVKGYCGMCSAPPPIVKCDTSKKFTYTKCTNDSTQLNLRIGSKYQWSPSYGLTNDTIRNPKCFVPNTTTYLVAYNDTNGCQLIDTILVRVKSPVFTSQLQDELICNGDSVQVSLTISASNILWSPNNGISNVNVKNPFLFPNSTTTYYVQFTDSAGCRQFDTLNVQVKTCCAARARFDLSKTPICYGENVSITNRSKGPITSYNWDFSGATPSSHNGANPPSLSFPNGNVYPVRLIVSNGSCNDTMIKDIHVIQFKPDAGRDSIDCIASLKVNLGSGMISTWQYRWIPTAFLDNPTLSNPVATIGNTSMTYVMFAKDVESGCEFSDTVVISNTYSGNTVNMTERICQGDSIKFFNSYQKAQGQYLYHLKKRNSTCDSILYKLNLFVSVPRNLTYSTKYYCKEYRDKYGKIWKSNLNVLDTIRNNNGCDSLYTITPIRVDSVKYSTISLVACNDTIFRGKRYSSSKLKADSVVKQSIVSNCDSLVVYYNITINKNPKAKIRPSIPNPIRLSDTLTLTASGGQKFLWYENNSRDSVLSFHPLDETPSLHIVRVSDSMSNCWDTAQYWVDIYISDTCNVFIPNAFSPGRNDTNDIFIPRFNACAKITKFIIFNRWGEKLFETNKNEGWDGRFKGETMPIGVYVYYLEMEKRKKKYVYKGSFTLFR